MAKQPTKPATDKVAAPASPAPAIPQAGPAQGASEATASSNGASDAAGPEVSTSGAGDLSDTTSLAELAKLASIGAPATIGVDLSSKPDLSAEALIDTSTGQVLSMRTIEPDEILLGSSILPAVVELIPGEHVRLGVVVAHAHELSAMSVEDWNAQGEEVRDAWIEAGRLDLREGLLDAWGLVAIEARSRDDQPYRRAGIDWSGVFQPAFVTTDQLKKLVNDRHLIVKS